MANKKFFAVILAMALVFGMVLIGCSDDGGTDSGLNGTWGSSSDQFNFDNGSFVYSEGGMQFLKGTYTTSGNNITVKITHVWGPYFGGETKWYSRADLKAYGFPDAKLEEIFRSDTDTYSVSGNQLTLGGDIYTKR